MSSAWNWITGASCTAAPILGIAGMLFPPAEAGAAIAGGVCVVGEALGFGDLEDGDGEE